MVINPERKSENIEGVITFESDVTVNQSKLVKNGNVVSIFAIFTTGTARSVYNRIFLIPSGFKPISTVITAPTRMVGTDVFKTLANHIYIDTTGDGCVGSEGLPIDTYVINATYITAD